MEDSAVAVNRVQLTESDVVAGAGEAPDSELAQQTTPASKLRRFSGILDSAVRSFLSGCRSPLGTSTPGGSEGEEGTSQAALFSPGAGRKEPSSARKRRVPLSTMSNLSGRAGDDEGNPHLQVAAVDQAAGAHSAVKATSGAYSPQPVDLITSSQRKSKKKLRVSVSAKGEGDGGENVLPRNLNKVFAADEDDDAMAAEAAANPEANPDAGPDGKRGGGGVLSNLLFSPMFTLARKLGGQAADDEGSPDNPFSQAAMAAHGVALECDEASLDAQDRKDGQEGDEASKSSSLVDGCEDDDSEVEYDYSQSFDPFLFIKHLPPLEDCVPLHRRSLLPRQTRQQQNKKTLVLDLDETLVHSSLETELMSDPMGENLVYDFTFPVHLGDERYDVYVYVRPGALEFLEQMQELYEVVVFTASQKVYAEKLLNILDPQRRFIRHRLFRDSCVLVEGNYLKDLSIIGRDLKDTIIVDNSPQAFAFQLSNGVPIESWFDDQHDRELLKLAPFLKKLTKLDDVRPSIEKRYKLHEKVARA
mmetsp:Transcript_3043/g.9178  ORF Transcript_3043/g.9178 Transcript_3043/m.9178 type:complete len:531 (-) Transcript_3043:137-1729(-)